MRYGWMATAILATGVLASHALAIEIAKDGVGKACIVVAEGASAPVRRAGEELKSLLAQVTGADLPMSDQAAAGMARILIGPQAAALAGSAYTGEGLGQEGIVIKTVGDNLILAGGEPRGTLYAVYTFLEDHAGCRWWTPTASTIPRKPTLKFENIDDRYVPPLNYREPYWETAFDRDWAVRNKVFGAHIPLDEQTGGRPPIASASHSFYYQIPPKRYFETHPEWFSELDGKRKWEGGQLCLSNEEMRAELTRNVLANLRKSKRPTHVSVAQNDGGRPCHCAKCLTIDEEEGSPAGAMLRFVNAVAAEVEREFPQVLVSTFAYTYSQPAPRITRPRDNVAVWLCTMNASYNLPLDKHKRNAEFAKDLRSWNTIAKNLYIWDYTTNFRHYLFIHPNLRVLGPNIRFFVANGVDGVFEQGSTGTVGAEFAELRAWVLAKLLWDPRLDDQKLIGEFLDGYYGPAGEHIRAYIDTVHDVMQASMQPLGCYEEPDRRFMKFETMSPAWSHLQAAERAVATDAELLNRVKVAQMPVMYAYMIRWVDLRKQATESGKQWPMAEDPAEVLAEYKRRAAALGIKRASELETFDKLEAKLKLPRE